MQGKRVELVDRANGKLRRRAGDELLKNQMSAIRRHGDITIGAVRTDRLSLRERNCEAHEVRLRRGRWMNDQPRRQGRERCGYCEKRADEHGR